MSADLARLGLSLQPDGSGLLKRDGQPFHVECLDESLRVSLYEPGTFKLRLRVVHCGPDCDICRRQRRLTVDARRRASRKVARR